MLYESTLFFYCKNDRMTTDSVVSACVCVSTSQLWAVVCLSTDTVAWNGPQLPKTRANLFLS